MKQMRKFIIIAFFVSIIETFAQAQVTVNYITDNVAKCKVSNDEPEPNETIIYHGRCIDGYADGLGSVTWQKNGISKVKITGVYSHGSIPKYSSCRKDYYDSGTSETGIITFEGPCYDVANGVSRQSFKNYTITAERKDNKIIGYALVSFKNGSVYVGEIKNGGMTGFGYIRYPTFEEYLGTFVSGKREGWGTLRGKMAYDGGWKNDKFDGMGISMIPDDPVAGITTIANFRNGEIDGDMTTYYKNGFAIVGKMHYGKSSNPVMVPYEKESVPKIKKISPLNVSFEFTPIPEVP